MLRLCFSDLSRNKTKGSHPAGGCPPFTSLFMLPVSFWFPLKLKGPSGTWYLVKPGELTCKSHDYKSPHLPDVPNRSPLYGCVFLRGPPWLVGGNQALSHFLEPPKAPREQDTRPPCWDPRTRSSDWCPSSHPFLFWWGGFPY